MTWQKTSYFQGNPIIFDRKLNPSALKAQSPVRGLIIPNKTRLAFCPVIGTKACSPRIAQQALNGGYRRSIVSSSIKSTALAGICFSRLTIAPFLRPMRIIRDQDITRALPDKPDLFHPSHRALAHQAEQLEDGDIHSLCGCASSQSQVVSSLASRTPILLAWWSSA